MPPTAEAAASAGHTGVLKMRGLPFSATKVDVVKWFSALPITPLNPEACAFPSPSPYHMDNPPYHMDHTSTGRHSSTGGSGFSLVTELAGLFALPITPPNPEACAFPLLTFLSIELEAYHSGIGSYDQPA